MENDRDFYVYMYLDSENVPFYIGKGRGYRHEVCRHLHYKTKNYLKHRLLQLGTQNVVTRFLHRNLSEHEAFACEKYWIKYIGRKNKNAGSLCNLTDGGEGPSGLIKAVSEDTKKKISAGLSLMWRSGKRKPITEATRKKMSISHVGQKRSPRTEEWKRKQSMAHSKQPAWNKGKKLLPLTEEHKQKISMGVAKHYNNIRVVRPLVVAADS